MIIKTGKNFGMKLLIKNNIKKVVYFNKLLSLKKKFSFLNKKKIILVGSGPNLDKKIFEVKNDEVIISCNASGANIAKLNLGEISLTVVDNELIDEKIAFNKEARSKIIKNNILKDLNLGHLISVQSNHAKDIDHKILKANIKSFTSIDKNMRKIIIDSVLGKSIIDNDNISLISTGVFSICLCLYFGAKEIIFTGFTLFKDKKNYFYDEPNSAINDSNYLTRNHSLADSVTIGILKLNGFKIEARDRDFYPLMSNWGTKV